MGESGKEKAQHSILSALSPKRASVQLPLEVWTSTWMPQLTDLFRECAVVLISQMEDICFPISKLWTLSGSQATSSQDTMFFSGGGIARRLTKSGQAAVTSWW